MKTETYETGGFYDEMFESDGRPRPGAEVVARRLASLSDGELVRRQKAADLALLNMGITFNVYGHEAGTEKVWPFDIVPRILPRASGTASIGASSSGSGRSTCSSMTFTTSGASSTTASCPSG